MFSDHRKHTLFDNNHMRDLDRISIDKLGVSGKKLMENAGRAVAEEIISRFSPRSTLILCGPGNNGGDGFVAAQHLRSEGWPIKVAALGDINKTVGREATFFAKEFKDETLPLSPDVLDKTELVVDALFGSGLTRPIEEKTAEFLSRLNEKSDIIKVAVDMPSGIDGNNGEILGIAARADLTVTFGLKKPGHLLYPGREYCGELVLRDIGHPAKAFEEIKSMALENHPDLWKKNFPWPKKNSHKYERGHVAVIGGNLPMTGAARMSAYSALRCASGLVTIFCPKEALEVYASVLDAVMVCPFENSKELGSLFAKKKISSSLYGPGAGVGKDTAKTAETLLSLPIPIVLDADAITSFTSNTETLFKMIRAKKEPVILTPHAGEFGRIFGDTSRNNKLELTQKAAKDSGAIIIHKGPDTVISDPEGKSIISSLGPATLATAGSGDVLAGLACSLIGASMKPLEASAAACWLHSRAATIFGPGLIAEDIIDCIPKALRELSLYK